MCMYVQPSADCYQSGFKHLFLLTWQYSCDGSMSHTGTDATPKSTRSPWMHQGTSLLQAEAD